MHSNCLFVGGKNYSCLFKSTKKNETQSIAENLSVRIGKALEEQNVFLLLCVFIWQQTGLMVLYVQLLSRYFQVFTVLWAIVSLRVSTKQSDTSFGGGPWSTSSSSFFLVVASHAMTSLLYLVLLKCLSVTLYLFLIHCHQLCDSAVISYIGISLF